MVALLQSFSLVAISEMGDKTQILSLVLFLRYRKPWTILLAILFATLANHLGATWFGATLATMVPEIWLKSILALTFFIFGLWILIPDCYEEVEAPNKHGVFLTTLVVFFLAEMGDKTQLATVALGATYKSVMMVTIGSTLGMLVSNSISIFGGERLIKVIPMNYIRYVACASFIGFGVLILPIW